MRCARLHTLPDSDVFDGVRFHAVSKDIWSEYIVPKSWDAAAVDVLLEKVFCPDALPDATRPVPEAGMPEWLWRQEAVPGVPQAGHEKDFRAVLHRVAGGWTYKAWQSGIFTHEPDARAFYDEARYLLLHRIAAPEISAWANVGLDWAYGLAPRDIHPEQRATPAAPEKNALKHFEILARQADLRNEKACALLPVRNADSLGFIRWKKDAEARALAQDLGLKTLRALLNRVMDACDRDLTGGFDPAENYALERAITDARRAGVGEAAIGAAISYTRQGFEDMPLPRADDETPDNITAVVSLPDEFVESALTGHGFMLTEDGADLRRAPADKLWDALAESVWAAGAPQVFFEDSAKAASPLPDALSRSRTGGLVFPADSAAPAATINLLTLDADGLAHAATIMAVALDTMAGGDLRPVVLGFTNLAGFLMRRGLSYDSDQGRAAAAMASALMTGAALRAGAAMGPCPGYAALDSLFLPHLRERMGAFSPGGWTQKGMLRRPVQVAAAQCPDAVLATAAQDAWARAYVEGRDRGFRNVHVTGIDPSRATQLLLGAETRGIAPESHLVRLEDGDGVYGRRLNPRAAEALQRLGYGAAEIDDMHFHVLGHGTLFDAPHINHATLKTRGFHQAAIDAVETALKSAQHIRTAFNKWTLGAEFCRHMLELSDEDLDAPGFDMLVALGFSGEEIDAANLYCCGAMTLDGAPHLKPRHRAVFDCRVSYNAQVRMQAAVETFLSGGVSHTIALDRAATIDEVQKLILRGWELGVKSLSLYRDASSVIHAAAPVAAAEYADMDVLVPQRKAVF